MSGPIEQRRAGASQVRTRAAADTRATELIRGVEVLVGKLADPTLRMDLAELDRYERAIAAGHRSNLLRLSLIEERLLGRADR